jgi:hypothetical protein
VNAIIDSGAAGNMMSKNFMDKNGLQPTQPSNSNIMGVNGAITRPIGVIKDVQIAYQKQDLGTIDMQIMEVENYDIILGGDWLHKVKAIINYETSTLTIPNVATIKLNLTRKYKPIIIEETDDYESQEILEEEAYLNTIEYYNATHQERTINKLEWKELDKEDIKDEHKELTKDQQRILDELLKENDDLFADDMTQMGRITIEEHRIPLKNENMHPIARPPYRHRLPIKEFIEKEVEEMLKAGVIEESTSSWSFPIVVVEKKNGKLRLCINYKELNEHTIIDKFPMPRIDEVFDSLTGAKWFSSLDAAQGFWQIKVREEDKPKTAFRTSRGLYQFITMPFGHANSPSTFQRAMNKIFVKEIEKFVHVYIDDINVYSKTFEEHIEHLKIVFQRVRESGMKLQRAKCSFIKPEITFLGHIVSREGLKVDPSKVEKLKQWKAPTDKKSVQRYLGFVNYYRKFVKDHSKIVKPIYALINKNMEGKFNWTPECQKSFELVNKSICEAVTLTYPDFTKRFQLTTDASKVGLGAVLEQIGADGTVKTIAFASKSLLDTETRYTALELEMLAAKWAMKHFRYYLFNEFDLYTDHRPLTGAVKYRQGELGSRINNWMEQINHYPYIPKYISGKSNKVADALSREVDTHLKHLVDQIESKTQ